MTAQSKPRRQSAKAKLEEVAAEAPEVQELPQEAPQNGVFVNRIEGEGGKLDFAIQLIGDAKITEAEFILKVGLKQLRAELDIAE